MPKREPVFRTDKQPTRGIVAGGASGGTGGVGTHALDDTAIHTGTLTWAQLNKTGSSLADLATRPHSALSGIGANDHHDEATAGDGISLTGQQIAVDTTVVRTTRNLTAGSGLTGGGTLAADRTFNVGAGTMITVGADTVGITAGANYQFIGTGSGTAAAWQNLSGLAGAGLAHSAGVLAVGAGSGITVNANDVALTTPGTLTVSSTNSASGNHTHAITTSSDPGAAAAILASTGAGGLTLQSLTVEGSVDILNGGDLTVGSNILFVDASLQSIGVNRAPDPQFDVDVAGALRARYLIGDAAIQLSDATLIAHFDGPMPVGVNFYGEVTGHMGQAGIATGGVTHPRGRFDKSVQIAEATTNKLVNGSFETDTSDWSSTTIGNTLTRTTEQARYGEYSLRVDFGSATFAGVYTGDYSKSAGATYSGSAWIYRTEAAVPLEIVLFEGATVLASAAVPADTGWVLATVTGTATTSTADLSLRIRKNDDAATPTIYIDGVQLEAKRYATPYCDGSLGGYTALGVADGSGHTWAGTAYASASSRLAASLYWSGISYNTKRLTVMGWFMFADVPSKRAPISQVTPLFFLGAVPNSYDIIGLYTTDALRPRITESGSETSGLDSDAVEPGVWYHVALTIDEDQMTMYVDGVATAAAATVTPPGGTSGSLYLGFEFSTFGFLNGWIDDFIVVDAALEADKIRAIYESNAPVFAESSVHHFRATPTGAVWADEEGLWIRDPDGAAVAGFYAGAESSKSWGGFSLGKGDIAFGRYGASDGGWLLFDRDGVSAKPFLKLGYADVDTVEFDANGAKVTGVLSVASGGKVAVYDGSAINVEMDSTYGFSSFIESVTTTPDGIAASRDVYGYTIGYPESAPYDFARYTGNVYTSASPQQWVAEMFGMTEESGDYAGVRVLAHNQNIAYDNDGNPQFIALHGTSMNQASIRAGQIFLTGAGTSQSGVTNKIVLDTGGGLTEIRQPGAIIGGTLTPSYHSNLLVARDTDAGAVMDSKSFSNTNTENTLVDYVVKVIRFRYALRDTVQNVAVSGDLEMFTAGTDQTQNVTLGTVTVTFVLKTDGRLRVKKTGANYTLVSIMGVMA